eukprot:CAMPEP_0195290898 /NCGR_PEP_ID=MMETSP0707-20130614/6577_1 /TAXON_ID=33640 /ORGANISM="Asterionellopsis glacialis, Strain CCMP134" /LENGTH=549 /DNA_ID=CAMNT_0040351081 /DNA_START=228 /DNA_END=1877 /DNA_ORIENTATION=+
MSSVILLNPTISSSKLKAQQCLRNLHVSNPRQRLSQPPSVQSRSKIHMTNNGSSQHTRYDVSRTIQQRHHAGVGRPAHPPSQQSRRLIHSCSSHLEKQIQNGARRNFHSATKDNNGLNFIQRNGNCVRKQTNDTTATRKARRHQRPCARLTSSTTKASQPRRQQSTASLTNSHNGLSRGRSSRFYSAFHGFRDSLHHSLLKPRTVPIPRWVSPQHYEITFSEILGHSSFILVAISYAVDDHMQLRIIAVAGSTAMLFFTYFHPHGRVLWLPFKWNALFIAINSYRIIKVTVAERRANQLSDEMLKFWNENLSTVDRKDFAKLVHLAVTESFEDGEIVVEQDESNRYIRLVLDGEIMAQRDNQPTYMLQKGNFVSESGLHAGLLLNGKIESCCSMVANGTVQTLRWDRTELMELLGREKDLRNSIRAALSFDIVRKLKGQRSMLSEGRISDASHWTLKRKEQTDARYDAILHNLLRHRDSMTQWKDELRNYRVIHHIDDEHHRVALKRFGWTPEEFEGLQFEGHEEEQEEEDVKHDFKWWAKDVVMRVFG